MKIITIDVTIYRTGDFSPAQCACLLVEMLNRIKLEFMGTKLVATLLISDSQGHFIEYEKAVQVSAQQKTKVLGVNHESVIVADLASFVVSKNTLNYTTKLVRGSYEIMLSYRGKTGQDVHQVSSVQVLWKAMMDVSGRDLVYMADNTARSKSEIISTLKSVRALVVVLTSDFFDSKWCVAELCLAVKLGKQVVVIFWKGDSSSEHAHDLAKNWQQVLNMTKKYEKALKDENWDLTTQDIRIASKKVSDVIHIGITLVPQSDASKGAQDILQECRVRL